MQSHHVSRFWLLLSALLLSLTARTGWTATELRLTPEEQQLLDGMDQIKVCVDPNWLPYERINDDGIHEGIGADYMALISQKLGKQIQLYPTQSWQESLQAIFQRHCDILSMAHETEERKEFLNFTRPYSEYPYVIVTNTERFYIEDISHEPEHLYAVTRGYAINGLLQEMYPQIRLLEVDNIDQGLQLVRQDKVFGYIDSVLSIGYAIQTSGSLDLKISGALGYQAELSIAVRNDLPLLQSVFQKALDSIRDSELRTIYNRWVSVRLETPFDYTPIWQAGSVILAFVAGILLWNRRLSMANKLAQRALRDLREAQDTLKDKNLQLQRLATTDILTGLHNRLKVGEILEQEVHRFHRYQAQFSVIMLDIDKFKAINDSFGHQTGDNVLAELAALLQKFSRTSDSVGRWGGEEFLLVCPGTALDGATKLACTLRQAIEAHPFPTVSTVTASFGVATVTAGDSSKDLISRADNALYTAKRNGRNRVESIAE